jgi:hypothetical protein
MAINFFEGSRRIIKLFVALWVLGVAAYYLFNLPRVRATFFVDTPFAPPEHRDLPCTGSDYEKYLGVRSTSDGNEYIGSLCFKAARFENGMFIPYRTDEKGWIYGDSTYSDNVQNYVTTMEGTFKSGAAAERAIDSQKWPLLKKHLLEGSKVAGIGWFVLVVISAVVGWIVRGFAGIPLGQDFRPAMVSSARSRGADEDNDDDVDDDGTRASFEDEPDPPREPGPSAVPLIPTQAQIGREQLEGKYLPAPPRESEIWPQREPLLVRVALVGPRILAVWCLSLVGRR